MKNSNTVDQKDIEKEDGEILEENNKTKQISNNMVDQKDIKKEDGEILKENKETKQTSNKKFVFKIFVPVLLVVFCLISLLVLFIFLPVKSLSQQIVLKTMDTSTLVSVDSSLQSGRSYICEVTCDLKNPSLIGKLSEIKIKLTNANVSDLQNTFENISFSDFDAQNDCVIGKINIDVNAFSHKNVFLKFNFYPLHVTNTKIEIFVADKQVLNQNYVVELP